MGSRLQDVVVRPRVPVVVEEEGGAWGAYAPAVPGVFATGKSEAEVTERMESALTFYFAEAHREALAVDAHDSRDAEVHRLAEEALATMTLADAATLAGVTLGAITNAITRGHLTAAAAPVATPPARGRRTRMVYRQEVERWRHERAVRLGQQLRRLTPALSGAPQA